MTHISPPLYNETLISETESPSENGRIEIKVFKMIELTGTSTTSIKDAIQNAITKAAQTVRQMRWFQVVETRGSIDGDQVSQWQVTLKVGFALEDEK